MSNTAKKETNSACVCVCIDVSDYCVIIIWLNTVNKVGWHSTCIIIHLLSTGRIEQGPKCMEQKVGAAYSNNTAVSLRF